jgi:hypothetical protein
VCHLRRLAVGTLISCLVLGGRASSGLDAWLVEPGRLGTKWESPALAGAFYGSLLLPCARLYLRKYGSVLVAGMWMLSWGSRGRQSKSGRPTGFSNALETTGDFPARAVVNSGPHGFARSSLGSALTIWGCAGNETFEGVDGQQPGCFPVGGAAAALAVVLLAGQLPAVGAEPVQQFQHRLPAVGVVLAQALPGTVSDDGPRARLRSTAVDGDPKLRVLPA